MCQRRAPANEKQMTTSDPTVYEAELLGLVRLTAIQLMYNHLAGRAAMSQDGSGTEPYLREPQANSPPHQHTHLESGIMIKQQTAGQLKHMITLAQTSSVVLPSMVLRLRKGCRMISGTLWALLADLPSSRPMPRALRIYRGSVTFEAFCFAPSETLSPEPSEVEVSDASI